MQVKRGVYVESDEVSSHEGSKQKRSATLHPLRIFVEFEDDVNALDKQRRSLIKVILYIYTLSYHVINVSVCV